MNDAAERTVFVVLGGTGGIGSAVCRELSGKGATVVVAARTAEEVERLSDDIDGHGRTVDARDAGAVGALLEEASELGTFAGVVNLVGSLFLRPAHLTSVDDFREALDVNLVTAFNVLRAAPPLLRDAGGGSVVLVSSAAARVGIPNHEAIAAAKGGVSAMARSAAATYATWGVRLNVVAPGLVETPLTASLTGKEKARERSRSMHPLGRLGTPEDIASAVAWLLQEPASHWVTGQEIGIDGGLATLRTG